MTGLRRLVCVLALGLLFAATAQPAAKVARVGVLVIGERPGPLFEAFKGGLREHGWVEGRNLVIEYRFAGEAYGALAADLVRIKVDVIFAGNAPAARAAKEATTAIPIVFHTLNDPVLAGLVASFARPGGNLTGNAGLGPELDQKRIQLLKEVVPSLSRATVLLNPSNPMTPSRRRVTEESAQTLKMQVDVMAASDRNGLDEALEVMARARPAGLIVFDDPVFYQRRQRIIEFATRHRIPAVYSQSGWAEQGGLMEYAPNQADMFRHAAGYVDRILRGAKPADLPIEQPTRFALVVNLKTAQALGLRIPPDLMLRADRVIK